MAFGGTVKLTGEKEYKDALRSIKNALKETSSELKLSEAKYAANGDKVTMLKSKNESLTKAIESQKSKLATMKAGIQSATAEWGENDTRVVKMRTEYNKTEAEITQMTAELNKNEAELKQEESAAKETGSAFNRMGDDAKNTKGHISSVGSPVASLKSTLKSFAITAAAAFSVQQVVSWGKACIEAYSNAAQQETKLHTIMESRLDASKQEIASVEKLIAAQSRHGVVSKDAQTQGAQQAATFVHQTSSLKKLIPAMNDLAVQQHGVNVTGDQMQQIGNLVGKVFTGQTGALKRVGISFTAAQEKVLKYGTEEEKAAMLSQVITDNVGKMNKAMANTDAGKIQNAKNQIDEMKESIGGKLLPVVADVMKEFSKFATFIQDAFGGKNNLLKGLIDEKQLATIKAFFKNIEMIVTSSPVRTILKVTFGTIATGITTIMDMFNTVVSVVTWIVSGVQRAYTAVVSAFTAVKVSWIAVKTNFTAGIAAIKAGFSAFGSFFRSLWNGLIGFIKGVPGKIAATFSGIGNKIAAYFRGVPSKIYSALYGAISMVSSIGRNIVSGLWRGASGMVSWAVNKFKNLGKSILKGIKHALGIHSPSTEFAEVGKYSMLGLIKGVTDNADLVKDAFASAISIPNITLPNISIPKMQGVNTGYYATTANGAQAASGNTITQNINIYQKVESPADVARAIRKQQLTVGLAGTEV